MNFHRYPETGFRHWCRDRLPVRTGVYTAESDFQIHLYHNPQLFPDCLRHSQEGVRKGCGKD